MPWSNGYYYRKRREGSKVVSEYVGAGLLAEYAAQLDEIERQKRQAEREAFKREVAAQEAIDAELDAVGAAVNDLVDAVLLATGHRQHKRQWRKRRE